MTDDPSMVNIYRSPRDERLVGVSEFTKLLFANQSLDELLTRANHEQIAFDEEPWKHLAEAAQSLRSGKRDRALALLQETVNHPDIETRVLLWSWTALRGLGLNPKPHEASAIQGIVIEIPIGEGADVLAAYADGTARYVNHSGKIIVWDLSDTVIRDIIRSLLESCKDFNMETPTHFADRAGNDLVRVTVLTLKGNRCAEAPMRSLGSSPINQVLTIGTQLMRQLIERTQGRNL